MKPDFTSKTTNIRTLTAAAEATAATTDAQKELPAHDAQEKNDAHETQKTEHARRTYSEEEKQKFLTAMKTAGRKGLRLPRINMAFSPELYDYIKIMSKVSGLTLTEFVNTVLNQYMNDHREQYEKALEFRHSL